MELVIAIFMARILLAEESAEAQATVEDDGTTGETEAPCPPPRPG